MIVSAICAGRPAPLPGGTVSAIAKTPLEGPVVVSLSGVTGDTQVNRRFHGYPAMAVHLFPAEHYAWLRERFGDLPALAGPGGMGENLHASGIGEEQVCIGDRFRLGTALLEASQPRQPCATIERHLGTKGVVKAMVESGRTGMFFRVLEKGTAQAGDTLDKVEGGSPDWTLRRAFFAVYGKTHADAATLAQLIALPRVSDRLVRDARKRLERPYKRL
ncbi:MOSC domain-containing protein [Aurantiacibacter luteus]|uniref:Sulfurase n=1 Tax=Aurantiacibacter luteus TaxID=1581420 RepID=A0A0G9MYK7_9SPHN|nr:MOSC domain-containing protein [Aurantiacibacter luteus]KLE35826.1 sulfurase [Aurantiacibacter luteus]